MNNLRSNKIQWPRSFYFTLHLLSVSLISRVETRNFVVRYSTSVSGEKGELNILSLTHLRH